MELLFRGILGSRPDPLRILETTRFVVQNARQVHIDMAAIRRAADALAHEQAEPPPWNYEYHFFDGTARTVNYLFLLDALNFSFWGRPRWTIEYRGKRLDGYWALAAALKRAAENDLSLLDASHLALMSPEELHEVLHGRGEIPLFEQRWRNTRELGTVLRDHWDGQATRLIAAAGGDAAQLAQKVADNFSSFDDIALYEGREVRFFKRAQIVVADIWGSFGGREAMKSGSEEAGAPAAGIAHISNIGQLTAFADYKLPQILRAWSVLHYATPLAKRVDRQVELRSSSPEEIEIRAATLWAVEFLRQELAARGRPLWSIQVDWILWEASQKRLPGMKPYHRVRTFYY